MIVDVHCHLWGDKVPSRLWYDAIIKYGASVSGHPEERVRRKIQEGQYDLTGDLLVKDMDEAGVDKACIHIIDVALYAGVGDEDCLPLEQQHRIFAEAVKRHPDRLIAFAGVDPRRPDAIKLVERAVKEWGFKALKLWPPAGFRASDACVYPLYNACQNLGIPVWIHSGTEIAPFSMANTHPMFVEDVAVHFPDLKIVIAHAGEVWWREGAFVANTRPNVSVDIANWEAIFLHSPLRFYRELRDLVNIAGRNKVLFGSDWPATRLVRRANLVNFIKAIKEPPEAARASGYQLTEEELAAVMGGNAQKLLKL
ncbi:MAG: amidohydrolase [Chloroflexi bacterium]|nr:amidohydrolase [Chloroflexota bacterium]